MSTAHVDAIVTTRCPQRREVVTQIQGCYAVDAPRIAREVEAEFRVLYPEHDVRVHIYRS